MLLRSHQKHHQKHDEQVKSDTDQHCNDNIAEEIADAHNRFVKLVTIISSCGQADVFPVIKKLHQWIYVCSDSNGGNEGSEDTKKTISISGTRKSNK